MQKDYKNKMTTGEAQKGSPPQGREEEYHFSGSGEYKPVTVRAKSREEAEAKWREVREKVEANIKSNNN